MFESYCVLFSRLGSLSLADHSLRLGPATPCDNSVSTGAQALTPSPLPARLPVLDQSAEQDRVRYMLSQLLMVLFLWTVYSL